MAYKPKTKETNQSVQEFLDTVGEQRSTEAHKLIEMMRSVSGEGPKMWGSSIIGFGKYHYVSRSKIEADWFKIGFSPRKAKITIYISCDVEEFADELIRLGKHSHGKGCIYITKLEDVDMVVLKNITKRAFVSAKDYHASK